MMATLPVPPSSRSFYVVITVASLMVGGAIGAQFAPRTVEARPPAVVRIPATPVSFAEPPPPAWTIGIEACDLYIARLESLMECDAVPTDTKETLQQAIDTHRTTWDDLLAEQPEMGATLADVCGQLSAAIVQAADSLHCREAMP